MSEYSNQSFKKGDVIMQEGDQPHCAYILKTGTVEIIKKGGDGQEVVLSTLKPGDIFGEMSMVDAEPRSATVRAVEDVVLIVVDAPTFKQKQEALDVFSRKLVQTLIRRLRLQNQQLADMASPTELAMAAAKGQITPGNAEGKNVLIREDYREKLNFGAIKLLAADINPQSRQGIKGGLHMQGFREIEDVNNVTDFKNKATSGEYDLIMVDGNLGVEDIAEVIKDIRHNHTQTSPFVIIFAVVDQPDPATLGQLAEAGLDDVLVKPIALGNIIDRVERRIKRRKPFVVTMNYVGPDRRSSKRPDCEEIPLVDVPNPLTYKALGEISDLDYMTSVRHALDRLEGLKIERFAVQMDWLTAKISTQVREQKDPTYFLKELLSCTKEMIGKLRVKSDTGHIQVCESILARIADFEAGMAEMSGEDWVQFVALVTRIKANLGPK